MNNNYKENRGKVTTAWCESQSIQREYLYKMLAKKLFVI